MKLTGVNSIESKASRTLVDQDSFAQRLALIFQIPQCSGAVCFTIQNPENVQIMKKMGQAGVNLNLIEYKLYIALSPGTKNKLNLMNQIIFQAFLFDCDYLHIKCVDNQLNINDAEMLNINFQYNAKNSIFFPTYWGIFANYSDYIARWYKMSEKNGLNR